MVLRCGCGVAPVSDACGRRLGEGEAILGLLRGLGDKTGKVGDMRAEKRRCGSRVSVMVLRLGCGVVPVSDACGGRGRGDFGVAVRGFADKTGKWRHAGGEKAGRIRVFATVLRCG